MAETPEGYLVCYDVACSSLIPQLYDTCDCPLVSVDKDNYVDGIMQYGNYSADPDLCPVPGYLTNMEETTLTSCIINCTTTTEPFMKVIWTGDYHVCTLLPLPYVRDFVDCDCVLRCGVVKQYDKDTYTVCYNCSDDLVINTNQKNVSSLLYEPNITCYRETDTCAIGCMDVCICGADFDSATFTLSGIYHNKGTETLCLKCIDYDYLTLKYDGCTCDTCIKVQDILNFCSIPRTAQEIMNRLGIQNQSRSRKRYIQALIDAGLLERTIPENPNDPNQKYRRVRK